MIIANQILHGYANGHQILASSCELDLDSRKKMDVLSDLNSRCSNENMTYYMGYSICDGKQYVIAKTWYAWEMPRPGCVWTHSLIFNIEEISRIKSVDDVIDAFQRPENNEYRNYSDVISFQEDDQCAYSDNDNNMLEYIIYTIYGSEKPRLVYFDEDESEIVKKLLCCIHDIPFQLLNDFSFTTMALEARVFNRKLFMYQVTNENLVEEIKRRNPELEVCIPHNSIEKMPYWVSCFCTYLKNGKIKNLYDFVESYGNSFFCWKYFNRFIRIYFLLQSDRGIELDDYFDILTQVIEENVEELIQHTVDLLLEDLFKAYSFENVEFQILENVDLGMFNLSKGQKNNLLDRIMSGQLEYLYPLLCKYKNGELKPNAKVVLEKIILVLKANDLKRVSNMDEDICIILVHMNQNLILSEDIWASSRKFQISMLYSAGEIVDLKKLRKLLKLVVIKYKARVSEEIYNIYGNKIISLLVEIIKSEKKYDEDYLKSWYFIFEKDPVVLLNSLCEFASRETCRALFCMIDMRNKDMIKNVNTMVWEPLLHKLLEDESEYLWINRILLQYVVIIFSVEYHFSNEVVEKVVRPIYNIALEDRIDTSDWYYFQHLLPEVEPCYSWDRCRRIREALSMRGYNIRDINL